MLNPQDRHQSTLPSEMEKHNTLSKMCVVSSLQSGFKKLQRDSMNRSLKKNIFNLGQVRPLILKLVIHTYA